MGEEWGVSRAERPLRRRTRSARSDAELLGLTDTDPEAFGDLRIGGAACEEAHDRARRRLGVRTEVDRESVDELERVIARLDAAPMLPLLDALPRRQGDAVRLRVLDHASYAHIGIVLGTSADNARLLVHRGLRSLARQLGEAT